MDRYMPLTGIDLIPASLLIDTQARSTSCTPWPTTASARSPKSWNIAFRAEIGCDTVVLSNLSKLLAIPLRDGCDRPTLAGSSRGVNENGRLSGARFCIRVGPSHADCLRQVPGDVPNWRLNARLNAASDS